MKTLYLLAVSALLGARGTVATPCKATPPPSLLPSPSSSLLSLPSSAAVYTPPSSSSSSFFPPFSEPSIPLSSVSLPSTVPNPCDNLVADSDLLTGKLHWGDTETGGALVTYLNNCNGYGSCAQLQLPGAASPASVQLSQVVHGTTAGQTYHFSVRYRIVANGGNPFDFRCVLNDQVTVQFRVDLLADGPWRTYGFPYVASRDFVNVACTLSSPGYGADQLDIVQITEVTLVAATCGPSSSVSSSALPSVPSYTPPCGNLVTDGDLSDARLLWAGTVNGPATISYLADDCGGYDSCVALALVGTDPNDARISTNVGLFTAGSTYRVRLEYRIVARAGPSPDFTILLGSVSVPCPTSGDPLNTWLLFSFVYTATTPLAQLVIDLSGNAGAAGLTNVIEITNIAVSLDGDDSCGLGPGGGGGEDPPVDV
ncbi:hypothetical protein SPI_08378 [Niveomyces insectorum RCEF 264]|uniref:Uncharacterized protein n=1 Tax=Niveomyces insectorum RCEF 264 TaxID=1081102 RepID=A0A167N992_9HYPO|nr:hypothetical protein SPI_08378 [Niveomyces insectorum RCEF 264]